MSDLDYYKDLFDKEMLRRKDMDSSINNPIIIITLIVGLLSYVNKTPEPFLLAPLNIVSIIIALLLVVSIFFLTKSYNNFFKGYSYHNLPHTKELRNYQKEIEGYNKKCKDKDKVSFHEYLIDNYVELTDLNGKVNKKRLYYIYIAKTSLIISLVFALILVIFYLIKTL